MDTLGVWREKLETLTKELDEVNDLVENCRRKRDEFLLETVGNASRNVVTIEGMAEMISRVIDMKDLEKELSPP